MDFDDLAQHAKQYPPDRLRRSPGFPADLIRRAARMYAEAKPAALQWGNAIEHDINLFSMSPAPLPA